jgi:predicted DNA-binding protein
MADNKKDHITTGVSIPIVWMDELKQLSSETGYARSYILRAAIRQYLNKKKIERADGKITEGILQ